MEQDSPPPKRPRLDGFRGSEEQAQRANSYKGAGDEVRYVPYALRNAIQASGGNKASPAWREDNTSGHFTFELGEDLTSRYKILTTLGEGTFGRVLECWDRDEGKYVAIKVIKNLQRYRDASMIEIDVLQTLQKHDITDTRHCVALQRWFQYQHHICMVFERLGPSLFDFIQGNLFHAFPIDMVRDFGRQLLESVAYMHELNIIHTDLKPENILLISSEFKLVAEPKGSKCFKRVPVTSDIKLIDFGSAIWNDQYHDTVVSTRHYRAPEIVIGLAWSFPCDLWSVGCILLELITGNALFQPSGDLEHLAMMERVLGPMPVAMVKRVGRKSKSCFRNGGKLDWPTGAMSRESIRVVQRVPRLQDLVTACVDHSVTELIDLIQGLLKYEPQERLPAKDALKHPFFCVE